MSGAAVIVGASHAGVQAAASLRKAGWQEPVILLSAEQELPYHRPPLSKSFLAGEKTRDEILLKNEAFYRDQRIDLRLDNPVHAIDWAARCLRSDGGEVSFDRLILATGSRARRLPAPFGDFDNLYDLRDLRQAERLKPALEAAASIVVIGGGFIGLEVAATAAKLGKRTTVIEGQSRPLARALPPRVTGFLADAHRSRGVEILCGARLEAIIGTGCRAEAVVLDDGRRFEADLILVGIGGEANIELGAAGGLAVAAGGLLVDEHGLTPAGRVYAIGDCAAYDNPHAGGIVRLESVQNAVDQAKTAAAHCTGQSLPYHAVPWFWTDQYDLKVQMAGLSAPGCEEVLRGDPAAGAFSVLHLRDQRLIAAFSVNRAGDHIQARKLIASGQPLDRECLADTTQPLNKAALPQALH